MASPRKNAPNVTRERILRQTPRPRISLASLSRREHVDPSLELCGGMTDAVKVKNRFQHSQHNVLCYSNSIYSSQNVNMHQQHSNSTLTRPEGNNYYPEHKYTATVAPTNYNALAVDKASSRFDICGRCHADTIVYEHSVKKCQTCGQFSLLKQPHISTSLYSEDWCNASTSSPKKHLVDGNLYQNRPGKNGSDVKQRARCARKPTKPKNKSKICLTISSDEDEDNESQKEIEKSASSTNVKKEERSKPHTDENDESKGAQSYRIPKLSDRMKLQGGRESENQSTDASPGLAIVRPSCLTTTEEGFELTVWHVQLGSLAGKGMTPLTLRNNVLRIEVECSFEVLEANKKKRMSERYKLALSSVEVSKIIVSYDTGIFMISVIPSKRYSDIINEALSKCIIDAGSKRSIEQQIIFIVSSTKDDFKRTLEKTLPHLQRIAPVSSHLSDGIKSVLSSITGQEMPQYVTRSSIAAVESDQLVKDLKTLFVYPPPPKKGGIALKKVDVDCLLPGIYLNDIIIDFYLKYLYEEILSEEQRARTYIFNSYFYTCLSKRAFGDSRRNESPMERMHAQVRKWTRDIDIFKRDFIIIPINEHAHWFLVVICFPSRVEQDESTNLNESIEGTGSDVTDEVVAESKKEEKGIAEEIESLKTEKSPALIDEKCQVLDAVVPMDVDKDSADLEKKESKDKFLQPEEPYILKNGKGEEDQKEGKGILNKSVGTDSNSSDDKLQARVYEQPCILLFDSLVSGGRSRVFSNLRHYLTMEWKEKRLGLGPEKCFTKNNLKGSFPKIPLQNNDCDCGVYILQFVESFFQQPILNYKFPIKKKDWFTKADVDSKRENIMKIISNLEEKYSSSN